MELPAVPPRCQNNDTAVKILTFMTVIPGTLIFTTTMLGFVTLVFPFGLHLLHKISILAIACYPETFTTVEIPTWQTIHFPRMAVI